MIKKRTLNELRQVKEYGYNPPSNSKGLSEAEIYKSLKKAKTPNLDMVMAGKFSPFYPSSETISLALEAHDNKVSNPFNFSALNKIRQEQHGRSFLPEREEETRAAEIQALREKMEQQAQLQAPQAPQAPQVQLPQPGQAPPTPTSGTNALRQVEINKLLGIR